MVSKPITSCSVTRWGSTPHGMKCSQRTKTVGAVRPLERGIDRCEERIGLSALVLLLPEATEARRDSQLPGFGLLTAGNVEGFAKVGFRLCVMLRRARQQ